MNSFSRSSGLWPVCRKNLQPQHWWSPKNGYAQKCLWACWLHFWVSHYRPLLFYALPHVHLLHKSEYNQIRPDFIQFFFAMTLKDRALNIALIPSYKSGARLFFSRASWRGNYVFHVSEYHFQLLIITELGVTAFDLKMAISKKASFYWQEDATPQVTAHELKRALLLREWFPQFYSPV